MTLNKEIEQFLLNKGALKVGFATRETMKSDIPSTDITYILPEATSAICFAVPLDKEKIRAFLRKDMPNGRGQHEKDNLDTYVKIMKITEATVDFLKEKGHEAKGIIPNLTYRDEFPEAPFRARPRISLRYLAVRSGVGTFGWSGNVGIKDFGGPILLGGLVTTTNLTATDPIPKSESHCNSCKLCTKVCAYRMFSDNKEIAVNIGGQDFKYSNRINITRCLLVCGSYTGLDKTERWSTWCPERFPYPKTDDDLYETFGKCLKIQMSFPIRGEGEGVDRKQFFRDRVVKKVLRGENNTKYAFSTLNITCGNCHLICWGDPKETAENFRLLTNSGCTVRDKEGYIEVKSWEEAKAYPENNVMDVNREISPKRKGIVKWIREINES